MPSSINCPLLPFFETKVLLITEYLRANNKDWIRETIKNHGEMVEMVFAHTGSDLEYAKELECKIGERLPNLKTLAFGSDGFLNSDLKWVDNGYTILRTKEEVEKCISSFTSRSLKIGLFLKTCRF